MSSEDWDLLELLMLSPKLVKTQIPTSGGVVGQPKLLGWGWGCIGAESKAAQKLKSLWWRGDGERRASYHNVRHLVRFWVNYQILATKKKFHPTTVNTSENKLLIID